MAKKKITLKNFKYDPSIDYQSEYELLPIEIKELALSEDYVTEEYDTSADLSAKLLKEVEKKGWTFDYNFMGEIYSLRPIGEPEQEFSKGGGINVIGDIEKMNPKMKELSKRLQKEVSSDRGIEGVASVIDEYNLSSYKPMGEHFHLNQKVIITDSSHDQYGNIFEISGYEPSGYLFIIREGTTLGFSVLPTQIKDWQPYDSMTREQLEQTRVIDYSSYSEMDDLEVNKRDAFVVSNDTEKKEILIEYVDSGEMETIDYSDQIMSEGGKVIRIDNRVDVSRWIYYNKKFENYTDKELKKYNGNNHATGNWNRKDAIYEAVETAMKKPYEKGGSIKKNGYFTGELSFLNW